MASTNNAGEFDNKTWITDARGITGIIAGSNNWGYPIYSQAEPCPESESAPYRKEDEDMDSGNKLYRGYIVKHDASDTDIQELTFVARSEEFAKMHLAREMDADADAEDYDFFVELVGYLSKKECCE